MGFAASARSLAFGAAAMFAGAMPFSHADAQSARAFPANSSRPVTTATATRAVAPSHELTAMDKAMLYSQGNAGVGILITVSDGAKQMGRTGDFFGRDVVDSLKARGVPAKYFFTDAAPGAPTLITAYINMRSYANAQGLTAFGPISIRKEFDGIKAKHMSTPMTAISPSRRD